MAAAQPGPRSADNRLPLWLRIVALVVENAQPIMSSGQVVQAAEFGHGELRRRIDPFDLGLPASSVTRSITAAIAYGMLEPGSNTRRLVLVPGALTEVGA